MIRIEQFGVGVVREIAETVEDKLLLAQRRAEAAEKRLAHAEQRYDEIERRIDNRRIAVAGQVDERTGQVVTIYQETTGPDSLEWGPPAWRSNGKRYGQPGHEGHMVRTNPRTGLPKGGGEDKPAVEHPTLLDIANRQKEIDDWHRYVDRGRRRCVTVTINLSAGGILLCPAAFVLSNIVVFFLSMLAFVLAGFAFRARNLCSHDEAPAPLELHKWNVAENSAALKTQEPEVFLAACSCPGCGDVEVHQFRKKLSIDPDWASVIRRCATCDREWAQK